ncbi:MAG: hypothetical protein KAX65_00585 [Caldilineaceae bacterium]|nr:hypothetical protein [Caldilineaceae bacterium]
MHFDSPTIRTLTRLTVTGFLAALLTWTLAPAVARAEPASQQTEQRATSVKGELNPAEYHYLGLEPSLSDGTIVLTLALEPADDTALRGAINFLVLTDDGLRRVLAGADPVDLDIAASAPLQFDPIGNKYQATFKSAGRGLYTVVVYNTGGKFGGYTLTALNGVLLDGTGQTETVIAAAEPLQTPSLTSTSTPTETMQAMVNASESSPLLVSNVTGGTTTTAPTVNALRISGDLDPDYRRQYLSLLPDVRDGTVNLNFVFDPLGDATRNLVNFYVLDEDGARRLLYGVLPEEIDIAAGSPKPFSPNPNERVASVNASGRNEYIVVPTSDAEVPVTYVMKVDGGVLIDRYGQTNEAKAAEAEFRALAATTPQTVTATAAVDPLLAPAATGDGDTVTLLPGGSLIAASAEGDVATNLQEKIEGALSKPYEHAYWSVLPTIRDGYVVLTMEYIANNEQLGRDNINFWVVNEDGMRQIVSGARPEDVALAAGSEAQYGPDKGKLQAAFLAPERSQYAVIVYNNSGQAATYTIAASGARLLAPPADSELLQRLP